MGGLILTIVIMLTSNVINKTKIFRLKLVQKMAQLGKVAIVSHHNKPATLNTEEFNIVIKESNVDEKSLYQYLASPFLMDYVSKRVTLGKMKRLCL